jgi:hypothetical protein
VATGSVTAKTGYFRLSFLTVAVTALVLALSGCGSSSQGGPTSPSASTTAATSATLAGSRASATTKTSTSAAASTATSAGAGDHACGNRKQRITPLTKGALAVLHAWLAERGGQPGAPLFPTSTGTPLTRKALARRIAKHAVAAGEQCPSLNVKTITPHTTPPRCGSCTPTSTPP